MKYILVVDTQILGRYDSDIHISIPEIAMELTTEQWNESIAIGANCFANGVFSIKDFRTESQLAEARKTEILARITQIESEKLRPVSDILTPELFTAEELEYSRNKLAGLQQELIDLRAELSNLN